jgi:hypothetical protein
VEKHCLQRTTAQSEPPRKLGYGTAGIGRLALVGHQQRQSVGESLDILAVDIDQPGSPWQAAIIAR